MNGMRLPNGYGGIVKLSGKRRKPYAARVTAGWHLNEKTGKVVQEYQILGYGTTKAEALQILARYNDNPIDLSVMTNLGIEKTPHCCRHTCISMLTDARID